MSDMKIGTSMKTMRYIAGAVLVLAGVVACNQKEESLTDSVEITIHAVMEETPATKTVIQGETTSVLWEPGDEVKVFYKTTGSRFVSQNTEPAGTADFTGTLNISGFFNEGFTSDAPLWAVYPFRAEAESDGESVTTTLPAGQIARSGSFAKSMYITLAKSSNTVMGFYNVCGGVRFSLTQEGVKEVVFQGQNDEAIAGKVKLAFEDGLPVVQEILEGRKTITLTAPGGGSFETGKWYYIVALPGTLSGGFKMSFFTDTQYATLVSPGARIIKRSIFGSLADADKNLVFIDKGDQPDPTGVIRFEDIVAKCACVEKYDIDGDGEVSYAEAAAVTSLEGLFTDWNTVTSFDEIRYFTGVTSTEGVFTGLPKLKRITIPDNITTLGTFNNCSALETAILPASLASIPNYCFNGCSSLKSVTLPSVITEIPSEAFRDCAALETVILPSTLTSIGRYAFSGCTSLTGINLPFGIQAIGTYAFKDCKALAFIELPDSLTSVEQYAFSGCVSLASVILPKDMTSIPQGCFVGCTGLASIVWPSALTIIEDYAFGGCSFKDNDYALQLPASVKTINYHAFGKVRHLILPSPSPITIGNAFEAGYTFLYVPAHMVDLYKIRTNWSEYAERILPIEDYPVSVPYIAVDLGLSVKWASCNVGAWGLLEYGDYFAWGEIEPKENYDWSTYKWCDGTRYTLTKYNTSDSNGTVDDKTQLDIEDDAANVYWGGSWRMPTDSEWKELIRNCTWTWTTRSGISGYLITSNINGNSFFLPANGFKMMTRTLSDGISGLYWSSSLGTDSPRVAWDMGFNQSDIARWDFDQDRCYGLSVRPVTE